MINWEQIRKEFESEDITLKALAEKYNVKTSTMRSRKNREGWQRNETQNVATRRNATDKPGGQKGNKNAVGNQGGAPLGNSNAKTHGLFAKYLPDETKEIMDELSQSDPSDIIWNNILIQYTAIIRAQQIMYVMDRDDLSNEESGYSSGEGGHSRTYAVQYAWDKHANFMNSQSRAMATLSNLIRQFVSVTDESDERRKRVELMDAQITKLKAETPKESTETINITIVDAWSDLDGD